MKSNRIKIGLALALLPLMQGCGFHSIPPGSVGVKFNGASGISQHLLKPEVFYASRSEGLSQKKSSP